MITFKGCPKCAGDLYSGEDMYGKFLNCLQCGYLKDLLADNRSDNTDASTEPSVVTAGVRKAA